MGDINKDSSAINFFQGTQEEYERLIEHDSSVGAGEGKILDDNSFYHILDDEGKPQGIVMLGGYPIGWKSGIQGLVGTQGFEGTQGRRGAQGVAGSQGDPGY